MKPNFILIPGPPVRASSWEPTAEVLREAGFAVQVPDVLARGARVPSWATWTDHLLRHVTGDANSIVVGHSSACALAVEMATRTPVSGVILVDGDIPPAQGATAPVRPALLAFIDGIADQSGDLPPWSRWFDDDPARASLIGVDVLRRDQIAFARFEQGLPRLRAEWFADRIELSRWDHVPASYIQASRIYDHAFAEAKQRGWPAANIEGTHLDPALRPRVMADALLSLTRAMGIAHA